uniref:VWFA domain-containing protein n=1 Tax=Leersia perrieri TaxID=77586 RepID=A0A0D9XUT9_9ORYZ
MNRIELLKRAMKLIIDKLGNNDHLAIVTVPVQASTIAEKDGDLVRMDAEGRNKAAMRMQKDRAKAVQVTAYAKVDAIHGWPKSHQGIPILVRVVAPPLTSDCAPVDIVAVLDVRAGGGLVPVSRMDMVKTAMNLVIDKLTGHDRLAIVPVQSSPVDVEDDLLEMNVKGRTEAAERVRKLAIFGGDNLSTALQKAVMILEARKEEKKNRAGFIILISDGNDDVSSFSHDANAIPLKYSVHTFGFRDAHNPRTMHHIATKSAGTYAVLNDGDSISESFTASINNIASIVAVDAEIIVSVDGESTTATLSGVDSGRFKVEIDDRKKNAFITAGALQAGAARSFLVYVDNVVGGEVSDLGNYVAVRVRYTCLSSQNAEAESRVEELQNANVVVVGNGAGDDVAASRLVAAEIVRVEAMRIVDKILERYIDDGKGLAGAADELCEQWRRLKESEYGREAAAAEDCLAAEMDEMEDALRRCSGISYLLSWQTRHSLQHYHTSSRTAITSPSPAPSPAPAMRDFVACGGAHKAARAAAMAVAAAGANCGGERKRRYEKEREMEMEMIERRLAFWKKVQGELPPMQIDGESSSSSSSTGDLMATVFQKATQDTLDHAMFHDVFLMEMIEHRLAYWSWVKCELRPMHHDSDYSDHMITIFWDASRESIDRVMFHDVFLAPVSAVSSDKVQLSIFPRVDTIPRRECHPRLPVLVRVTAPATAPPSRRAPVDLVALLDISCGGAGAGASTARRLEMLRKAMEHVIGCLGADDRLAIVPFHSSVVDATGLLEMSVEGRCLATRKVMSLAVSGGTKLFPALNAAVDILDARHADERCGGGRVAAVFAACIRRVTSVVAIDAHIELACSGASIVGVESGRHRCHVDESRRSGFVYAGELSAGDVKNFIVYVDVDVHGGGVTELLTAHGTYTSATATVAAARRDTVVHIDERMAVVQRRDVDRVPDVSRDVAAELVRVEAIRMVAAVLERLNAGALAGGGAAAAELRDGWCRVMVSEDALVAAGAASLAVIEREIEEMESSLNRCSVTGMSQIFSWLNRHRLQLNLHVATPPARSPPVASNVAAVEGGRKSKDGGGGGAKRKCVEMDMIEERLAYWSKVKHDLPLMFPDQAATVTAATAAAEGTASSGDHAAAVFRDASLETINRAMFHDIYLVRPISRPI